MAVKNNLAILMAKKNKFKLSEIARETGLNKNTIMALRNNKASGIQYDTLETLCDYFGVDIGEFLIRESKAS